MTKLWSISVAAMMLAVAAVQLCGQQDYYRLPRSSNEAWAGFSPLTLTH